MLKIGSNISVLNIHTPRLDNVYPSIPLKAAGKQGFEPAGSVLFAAMPVD